MMDLILGTNPVASWWLAVIIVAVVTLVVALLLYLVIRTAAAINRRLQPFGPMDSVWRTIPSISRCSTKPANIHKVFLATPCILKHSEALRDQAKGSSTSAVGLGTRSNDMITILTFITCLASLLLLLVVAIALVRINSVLESIGGKGESYLAKLRLGLRAIEERRRICRRRHRFSTRIWNPSVAALAVDATLGEFHKALVAQERRS